MRTWPGDVPRTLRLNLSHCHPRTAVVLVTLPGWVLDFVAAPIESLSAPARCAAPRLSEPEVGASDWLSPRFRTGRMSEREGAHTPASNPGARAWPEAGQSGKTVTCMHWLFMTSFPLFWFLFIIFPFAFQKKKKIISSV